LKTFDEGHLSQLVFVAITYGKVSLWALEKPAKLGEFSPSWLAKLWYILL